MPWCPRCGTGISQHEMTEGYADREDPGLTVRFPLVDRPGESLLVWTTTPWTLAANVAAAVGPDLAYVRVRQGDETLLGRQGDAEAGASSAPFEVLEEREAARSWSGWRYEGPFDALPAVREAFAEGTRDDPATPYEHRVDPVDRGRRGRGHRHRPHRARRRRGGLPARQGARAAGRSGRSTRTAGTTTGFDWLSGKVAPEVAEEIVDDLARRGFFYHLEPYTHRYPHCWRCGTPLLFRLVDEWFISMGPVYDKPRDQLTKAEVDASLRYQIMDVVDEIRWIPSFGYERELDWLMNMHDWMISKKRYWGLALPIYDCPACGTFDVIGGREELEERARRRAGSRSRATRRTGRTWTPSRSRCPDCGEPVTRIPDVGNPWLDAGIVPFSTLHFREDREYWAKWFPADFITESFPGQFRNWFYAMLAMSTVLRREAPFKTIFGYATLFGEDGRPMHKSWGNSIEFDEAAERMGVDVMRWLYTSARPEDNILFGWHAADERAPAAARALERLRVLRDATPALAGWSRRAASTADGGRPRRSPMDRWILSRAGRAGRRRRGPAAGLRRAGRDRAGDRRLHRRPVDLVRPAARAGRFSRNDEPADRDAAFATLHAALVGAAEGVAPILPFLAETDLPEPRRGRSTRRRPDSRPPDPLAGRRAGAIADPRARGGDGDGAPGGRARRGRCAAPAGLRVRQPLARMLARDPGCATAARARGAARPHRGRAQRQGGRAHRRRLGARRAAGQAAAAEDRQAARRGDPGGHGRGARGRVRDPRRTARSTLGGRDARPRRGRDPRDAAPGHGGRARRGARRRHRHASSRPSSGPRATPASCSARSRTCARTRAWTSTRGSSCGSTALPAGGRAAPRRRGPRDPGGRSCRREPRRTAGPTPVDASSCPTARVDDRARRPRPAGPRPRERDAAVPTGGPGARAAEAERRQATTRPAGLGGCSSALAALIVVLDQLTKAWIDVVPRAGPVGRASSATSSGSSTPRTTAACSGCSAARRSAFALVSMVVIALIVVVPRALGPQSVPVDHARAAARRRAGQPRRPAPAGPRRRLRRCRDRRPALVHVQRRGRRDQLRDPAAPRREHLARRWRAERRSDA